ncbi:Ankyrin repeat protein 1 [Giardia muris]|uniref:Ankyrin repeat protein 1 n=1 Tax=Giardia muris TaxID=5742 RepID=A0A4Z1SWL2_GIAMU|nr:Ankyrin repeat protein 1 [Giardia muris]|eukprot:TNJ29245.1 Ankyrin repeat protein 1 [Giardia muris]
MGERLQGLTKGTTDSNRDNEETLMRAIAGCDLAAVRCGLSSLTSPHKALVAALAAGDPRVVAAVGMQCAAKGLVAHCPIDPCIDPTELFQAATLGDVEQVQKHILQLGKRCARSGRRTALHVAAEKGHVECVRLLYPEAGYFTEDHKTALMLAAAGGHRACVELLLPAEKGLRNGKEWTALAYAIHAGHQEIVELLLPCEAHILRFATTTLFDLISSSSLSESYKNELRDRLGISEERLFDALARNDDVATRACLTRVTQMNVTQLVESGITHGSDAALAVLLDRIGTFGPLPQLIPRLIPEAYPTVQYEGQRITALMEAALAGDLEGVHANTSQIGMITLLQRTALQFAFEKGHTDCVRALFAELSITLADPTFGDKVKSLCHSIDQSIILENVLSSAQETKSAVIAHNLNQLGRISRQIPSPEASVMVTIRISVTECATMVSQLQRLIALLEIDKSNFIRVSLPKEWLGSVSDALGSDVVDVKQRSVRCHVRFVEADKRKFRLDAYVVQRSIQALTEKVCNKETLGTIPVVEYRSPGVLEREEAHHPIAIIIPLPGDNRGESGHQ